MKRIIFLYVVCFSFLATGQVSNLERQLKHASHDSIRCKILDTSIFKTKDQDKKIRLNRRLGKIIDQHLKHQSVSKAERDFFLSYKVKWFNHYALYYSECSPPNDSLSLHYFLKCLPIQKQLGDRSGLARTYNKLGILYLNAVNFPAAIKNHRESLKISIELGDQREIANSYHNISTVYSQQGNYPQELKYLFKALKIREKLNDKADLANTYNNIGLNFRYQEKTEDALFYLFRALKLYTEIRNEEGMGDLNANIGIIYIEQKKYPEAIKYQYKALDIYTKINDLSGIGFCYGNLASAYLYEGKNYEKAKEYYLKSLQIREQLGRKTSMAYAYLGLGMTEFKLNNGQGSKDYLEKALILAQNTGSKQLESFCYENLSKTDSALFNYQDAFEHYKRYISIRDSLRDEEFEAKNLQTHLQYQYDKKEALIKEKHRTEKARNKLYYGIVIAILLVVLLFLMLWYYYSKQKRENEKVIQEAMIALEVTELERRRISADLHDDLGAGISTITLLSNRLLKQTKMDDAQEDANRIYINTQKISEKLTEVIWELNSAHNNLEDLLLFIQKQGNILFKETTIAFSMLLPLEIPAIPFTSFQRKQLYLSVKECFNNIIKHSEATQVSCCVSLDQNLTIEITDNGKGFDVVQKLEKSQGEGLKNLHYRLEKLAGNVRLSSSSAGTAILFEIPLTPKDNA